MSSAPKHSSRRPRRSRFFPPADAAPPQGLIGLGGELTSEWILDAYRNGIFPWPFDDGDLAWWSPDPRAIIEFDRFHMPRRLERVRRSGRFELRIDCDFTGVIDGCATAGDRKHQTWITPALRDAYVRLHGEGHAHSVEAWYQSELAGGVYGLAVGGLFAAESMFYRVSEASKLALVHLVEHLRARGYRLLDIQQLTPHTSRFGASEIPRREYLRRLSAAVDLPVTFAT
ncbi:MAG TPA: leucyl/phenylalanyl-tRNA--protein transferase [Pirellulales bacterium]|nr:leucyl/phenylalanyl-tRNA--protein transferase [Pirellulales bacterium]